jgi:predicted Zn-dependent protease
MKKVNHLLLVLVVCILASCGATNVVPVTGRKQRINVNSSEILSLSKSEYDKYLASSKLSTNSTNTAMVKRVGQKLANAVETFLRNNGYEQEVANYNWEFNLVQGNEVNAFCMPGGKIVVYEGLLPVTQNETALAIVLGHEIAHAVANHSAEQMTKQQDQQLLGNIIGAAASAVGVGTNAQSTISSLYGLGSQMATLKYSRNHENEADHIGLIFAAMAGYNPQEALTFWQRMAQSSQGNTPEFLSTHPSDATRIANIQKLLPEAMKYYNGTTGNATTTPKTTKTIRIK